MKYHANRRDTQAFPVKGRQEHSRSSQSGGAVTRAILLLLTVLIVSAAVIWGISSRRKADAQLGVETRELAVPSISVVRPKAGVSQQEIILPGAMQPFADAPIYARIGGYLKSWHVDIGTRVKTGQLLAEIDAPEVDQQLEQARADMANSEANLRLSEITATRYQDLLKTDSVSRQDVDNAAGSLEMRKTAVESAKSNVRRLQELQGFKKIYAPFEGLITARNTDIGALIDSGASGGTARELFHIAAIKTLRVYVNVPQVYAPHIKPGLHAQLTLTEYPGRRFDGTIVRDSGSIDNTTRTLRTEIDVDNAAGQLRPGSYAEVHLKLPTSITTFTLPINTFIFKAAGMQVATVKNGKTIELIPITPGRNFGTTMEVIAGLKGDEAVVVDPSDSLADGQVVKLAQVAAKAEKADVAEKADPAGQADQASQAGKAGKAVQSGKSAKVGKTGKEGKK
jgi:RND family efflux transporter MFP subunit